MAAGGCKDGGVTFNSGPVLQRSSMLTQFILAPNPGPMSLDGTNSYVLRGPGQSAVVVVDPGPQDETHLAALAGVGPVDLILVTHRHADHTAGSARLHQLTGAPVRAVDFAHCHGGGEVLVHGEVIHAAGLEIAVLATPGHTSDSACFHLPADGPDGAVLTGDTILGRGTTVLDFPDGTLGDYLASLDLLEALGPAWVLPAHGPVLASLESAARGYRSHREERLGQIRTALDRLGRDATVGEVADAVYAGVGPSVRRAAELSVAAQLTYLRGGGEGRAVPPGR
ncbi:MBL fold metallo-hydrolase [Pseudarthrobacter sp. C4D7]|uniref:MBL fold metallo-hydrolase n=1 Tax=Pseudarthrobacter sp. C4D7 TaxID=2735268 RepID=UPI0015853C66|nr:MBL fold metallo-hydrolase [Pseudarthrobacter sp. C4D7]NUT70187.1 MBL fold metallo-hydrolase [Pseudarthrobacter sp. C4D7]